VVNRLADTFTVIHFIWILFMLAGFFWTVAAPFVHRRFFDFFWFRSLHAAGILIVVVYSLSDKYCPLTVWENFFRQKAGAEYAGGFIQHYLEKLVYPDLTPVWIGAGTAAVAIVSIGAYLARPPQKVKDWSKKIFTQSA
jgi:hypothetical protein